MLLSIVIPTKNRQQYCLAAVKQIISLNLDKTQVVIQDNSDDRSLEKNLKQVIEYGKVKYHYREGVISFVDNFSEAVSLCDGEYICMIGDDDGILPNIKNSEDKKQEVSVLQIMPDDGGGSMGNDSLYF